MRHSPKHRTFFFDPFNVVLLTRRSPKDDRSSPLANWTRTPNEIKNLKNQKKGRRSSRAKQTHIWSAHIWKTSGRLSSQPLAYTRTGSLFFTIPSLLLVLRSRSKRWNRFIFSLCALIFFWIRFFVCRQILIWFDFSMN